MSTVTRYLNEADVEHLLDMPACIEAVEGAFRQWADGKADNRPRARASVPGSLLHTLSGASEVWGRMAAKVYATTRQGSRFVVLLFDAASADLLAVIEADRLGQTRTGAATGVATKHLARADARVLGILGTGWQARSQATAVAAVRSLQSIRAYGRDRERLEEFRRDTHAACGVEVTACATAEEAVREADIVVTATSSAQPVLHGDWLRPGVHVNAVGSNRPDRRELDDAAVERADLVVVDALDQARMEAGDLLLARGGAAFAHAVELRDIVGGDEPGRRDDEEVTLFKSIGVGLEDLAAASLVYDRAVERDIGAPLPSRKPG